MVNGDDANSLEVVKHAHSPCLTFGMGATCTVNLRPGAGARGATSFQFDWPGKLSRRFQIPLLGEHNVRNATGVIILALHNGIAPEAIQRALDGFIGVKRRLEWKGSPRGILIYDDFAHHPTAIRETVKALRRKHPKQRLFAVFEPRSNTSVLNVHQGALCEAFDQADAVLFSYPHRLEKIPVEQRLDVDQVVAVLAKAGKIGAGLQGRGGDHRKPGGKLPPRRRGLGDQQRQIRQHPSPPAGAAERLGRLRRLGEEPPPRPPGWKRAVVQ